MAEPAYRTISEVAAMVGVPHHVLRFWETKFPTIAPLKRGGNRRYYRPADVAAAQTVARLLHHEGYTIKGAQKLLEGLAATPAPSVAPAASPSAAPTPPAGRRLAAEADLPWGALAAIRDDLAAALANAR